MEKEKFLLNPTEAESLLPDGNSIHNIIDMPPLFLGANWTREETITAFKEATSIEVGGSGCRGMGHPIVVFAPDGRHSFFEANMVKLAELEEARGS
jgi:hypothetical protein